MSSLSSTLMIGRSSLLSRQQEMTVIGNNLSNAGRVGYHRQSSVISPSSPIDVAGIQMGTGSRVSEVVRSYKHGIETSLRQAISQQQSSLTYAETLEIVEFQLAPGGTSSLAESMTRFSSAWQELGNQPEDTSRHEMVLQRAEEVAQQYNTARDRLEATAATIADSAAGTGVIADDVAELNNLAIQVAELNRQISKYETRAYKPQSANDLRDVRDGLINQMAKIGDVTAVEASDKMISVTMGGVAIVAGTVAAELTVDTSGATPSVKVSGSENSVAFTGGRIHGHIEAYVYTYEKLDELSDFADVLRDAVNLVHQGGFTADGAAGGDMFSITTDNRLRALISNPNQIAASTSVTGDGGANARQIWSVLNGSQVSLSGNSLVNHADRLVDRLASNTAMARASASNAADSEAMYRGAVLESSGVNVDEEMVAMLQIQRAYQASARFVSAVDEMFADVLNRL